MNAGLFSQCEIGCSKTPNWLITALRCFKGKSCFLLSKWMKKIQPLKLMSFPLLSAAASKWFLSTPHYWNLLPVLQHCRWRTSTQGTRWWSLRKFGNNWSRNLTCKSIGIWSRLWCWPLDVRDLLHQVLVQKVYEDPLVNNKALSSGSGGQQHNHLLQVGAINAKASSVLEKV